MTYLVISIVVFNTISYLISKRLSKIEMYATVMFAVVLQIVVDLNLGMKFQMYSYFEKGIQWYDFLALFGVFPAMK